MAALSMAARIPDYVIRLQSMTEFSENPPMHNLLTRNNLQSPAL
jgi:hypothetical protein